MGYDLFNKLSNTQLKQQILVLLGYSPDTIQVDEVSFAYCFANFFHIFKADNDKAFNVSQRNSLDCILGKKTYSDCIDSLIMGNKKSFIIAPLATAPHISFCVIYKSKNGSSFNCTVINKENNCPRSYTRYTIPRDNIQNIVGILGYKAMQFITIDKFLSVFNNNCSKFSELDLNCTITSEASETNYIIETESAFNFAYSKAFLFKYFMDNTPINTKNNWDISTTKSSYLNVVGPFESSIIHERFLDNIKSKCPALSHDIDEIISVKEKNDKLCLNFSTGNDFKVFEFFFKLAFDYDETGNLGDCIKKIYAKNLASNFDFIYHLCTENNLNEYTSALDILKPILDTKNADLSNLPENLDTLETLFPTAISQLSSIYSNYYLVQALENYNCAMNMINDMLNIAQKVNDYIISGDLYDEYFTPYDDINFEYPNTSDISSSDKNTLSDDKSVVTNNSRRASTVSDIEDYYTPDNDIPFEYQNTSDEAELSDSELNIETNGARNSSVNFDEEYYTPLDGIASDYHDDYDTKSKHTSTYSDNYSYNPTSINFGNIYDMDDSLDKEVHLDDYLNSEAFKDNVTTMLVKSLEACCASISIEPDNALCHYILGISLLYLGRTEDAQLEFAETCDLIPTNADFRILNAVCLILNDKLDDATLMLKSSLEIEPDNDNSKKLDELLSSGLNLDEIQAAVIDSYMLNYIDISLELSSVIASISLNRDSLYSINKFAYAPLMISDSVSEISELPNGNLTRNYSSLDALNKSAADLLGSNLTRSYSLSSDISKSISNILDSRLFRSNSSLSIIDKSDSNVNLSNSKSVSYLPNINTHSSIKDLDTKSSEHNNIKHKSIDI